LVHDGPNTRKKEIMAIRRMERAEIVDRERRRSDVIMEIFRSRAKLGLEKSCNFNKPCLG